MKKLIIILTFIVCFSCFSLKAQKVGPEYTDSIKHIQMRLTVQEYENNKLRKENKLLKIVTGAAVVYSLWLFFIKKEF